MMEKLKSAYSEQLAQTIRSVRTGGGILRRD